MSIDLTLVLLFLADYFIQFVQIDIMDSSHEIAYRRDVNLLSQFQQECAPFAAQHFGFRKRKGLHLSPLRCAFLAGPRCEYKIATAN